jgi:hypothetical protein
MPMRKDAYPPIWPTLALAIKEAAGWTCQDCGMQCRRPGEPFDTHRRTMSVHHIDHDPPNVDPSNLIALCARCHLIRDAPHHAQNAARTRRAKRIATGQTELELEV